MQLFGMKDPQKVAEGELRTAQLQMLEAQAALEHYQHHAAMLQQRITRLTSVVGHGGSAADLRANRPFADGRTVPA